MRASAGRHMGRPGPRRMRRGQQQQRRSFKIRVRLGRSWTKLVSAGF